MNERGHGLAGLGAALLTAPLLGLAFAMAPIAPIAQAGPPVAETESLPFGVSAQSPPISIKLVVGHATSAPGPVDAEFRRFKKSVPSSVQSIRLTERRSFQTRFGQEIRHRIAAGTEIRVVPVTVHAKKLHLHVTIPDKLDTRMRLTQGRAMLLGAVAAAEGGHLVIMLEPDFGAYLPEAEEGSGPVTHSVNEKR